MLELIRTAVGRPLPLLLPPFAPGMGQDGRGMPLTREDDIHLAAMPDTRARPPRRTWLPDELLVDRGDVTDREGALRVPLPDALGMAIFISGVRAFELLPEGEHAERVTVGRTVVRREGWNVPAGEVPSEARDLPALARDRGLPRRLFAKSPLERKPMYLDVESPVLTRVLCRHARQAALQARVPQSVSPKCCRHRKTAGSATPRATGTCPSYASSRSIGATGSDEPAAHDTRRHRPGDPRNLG
jgi:hypothetical protein